MPEGYRFYSLLLVGAAIVSLALCAYGWLQRRNPGGRPFAALMLAAALYSGGYAFELGAGSLQGILPWVRVEYFGIPFIAPLFFVLALEYSGHRLRKSALFICSLFVVPLLTFIAFSSNDFHHLFYREIGLNGNAPFPVLAIRRGILYYLHTAYLNVMTLGGTMLIVRTAIRSAKPYRKQALIMLVGAFLPWTGHLAYLTGVSPWGIDLSPLGIALAGLVFAFGLFRYRLFDLVPVARDRVFETMSDAVLVVDQDNRLGDMNSASAKIFPGLSQKSIGLSAEILFEAQPRLLALIRERREGRIELSLGEGDEARHYDVRSSKLGGGVSRYLGMTIILNDDTERILMIDKLRELSRMDGLTLVHNRRYFFELCQREMELARRKKRPVSFIMIDLDHFKRVNDAFGHQAGDDALKLAAGICAEGIRSTDFLCRYGGEEFAVLLPETTKETASSIAERLRARIAEARIAEAPGGEREIRFTASLGVSGLEEVSGETIDDLVRLADAALYKAKAEGRNRTVLAR